MKFLLLDRDGTIIIDKGYDLLGDPEAIEFVPGAVEGLKRFRDAGVKFFVVTNQSGINRGFYSEDDYITS